MCRVETCYEIAGFAVRGRIGLVKNEKQGHGIEKKWLLVCLTSVTLFTNVDNQGIPEMGVKGRSCAYAYRIWERNSKRTSLVRGLESVAPRKDGR